MQPLENQTNVFGDPLQSCSMDPLTGFFRTGCCDADSEDIGKHFVCAHVDDAFDRSKDRDLNLSLALNAGCTCLSRSKKASNIKK